CPGTWESWGGCSLRLPLRVTDGTSGSLAAPDIVSRWARLLKRPQGSGHPPGSSHRRRARGPATPPVQRCGLGIRHRHGKTLRVASEQVRSEYGCPKSVATLLHSG